MDAEAPCKQAFFPFGTLGLFGFPILIPFFNFHSLLLGETKAPFRLVLLQYIGKWSMMGNSSSLFAL